jgi:two-component system NarL family sensor kinase
MSSLGGAIAPDQAAGATPVGAVAPVTEGRRGKRSVVTVAVLRFVLAGLLAACLIGAGTFFVVQRDAESQAISHAVEITQIEGRGIIEPALSDTLLSFDVSARGALDTIVHERILTSDVVRVKLWTADGAIVYSDESRLFGQRFGLGAGQTAALRTGSAAADVSDVTEPENQYERNYGKLLEVYFPIRTPHGTPLLFETYQRYSAITQYQQEVWSSFLPVLIAGMALLFVVQIPLAWALARRLRTSLADREALLERAISASGRERQRIARDLHDGVVQQLAGVGYSLQALTRRLRGTPAVGQSEVLPVVDEAMAQTRVAMQDLRTLIVEIAPPDLLVEGIDNALRDLLEPLVARGITTRLEAASHPTLSEPVTLLVFRVAQEALRNVATHAAATHVEVRLRRSENVVSLEIVDDGRGFSDSDLEERRRAAHIGLRLLRDVVHEEGGRLIVDSRPGEGTRVAMDIPNP